MYRLSVFAALLLASLNTEASAQETESTPLKLEVSGGLGWLNGEHSGGPAMAASGRVRYQVLSAGLALEGSTILLQSTGTASALLGLSIPVGFVRFDAFGELGFHAYANAHSGLLSNDPGANALLPFAGARFGTAFRVLHTHTTELWFGPTLRYADDLSEVTRQYTYISDSPSWFGNDLSGEEVLARVTVGQAAWSLHATMTVSFSIPPCL